MKVTCISRARISYAMVCQISVELQWKPDRCYTSLKVIVTLYV